MNLDKALLELSEEVRMIAHPMWWRDQMGYLTWYGESRDGNLIYEPDPLDKLRRLADEINALRRNL